MKRKKEPSVKKPRTPAPKKAKKEVAKPEPKVKEGDGKAVDFTLEEGDANLEINRVETSKDQIEQPPLALDERKIIPPLGSSVIICGKSGSGKSTLLQNLLADPRFYGPSPEKPNGWFSKKFLFAPTGASDDILKSLGIKDEHVFTELDKAPELLKIIQDSQQRKLKGGKKAHTVEQFAVIFEDCIGETQFMNTCEFKKMFYMVRHINCTTFICAQHFNRVPRVCRLQASFIFFFAGSASEVDIVVDMFAPPLYNKKEFKELVNEATKEDFSFLTICMKTGWRYRFRKNLNQFFQLGRLLTEESGEKDKKKDEEKEQKTQALKEQEFSAEKGQESLKKVIALKRQRDVSTNEQASKISRQWANEGPRGRIVW